MDYFVHESSYIDQPCSIGKGTKIWHFCHVMQGCEIGENCNIGQNVCVLSGAKLGNNVKVQNNVSIYDGVVCEDGVFLGPSCVFTNVINPRSTVNRKQEYKQTLVKEGASIGANATILCGNTIGRYALVGAGSVVTCDVPDYALVRGNPARVTGHLCKCGEKLEFAGDAEAATCAACGRAYSKENGHVAEKEKR
ncbi:MAG TPA: N-acetyltransferase [Clostridiales bacterium]|nr:N-acetyltransferase [Clostridiales bacterium]